MYDVKLAVISFFLCPTEIYAFFLKNHRTLENYKSTLGYKENCSEFSTAKTVWAIFSGVGFEIFSFPRKSLICQDLCPPSGSDSSADGTLGSHRASTGPQQ